jgi:hypothetical protein
MHAPFRKEEGVIRQQIPLPVNFFGLNAKDSLALLGAPANRGLVEREGLRCGFSGPQPEQAVHGGEGLEINHGLEGYIG